MPLMPAFGLLMGRYLAAGVNGRYPWPRLHRSFTRIMLGLFALTAVLAVVGVIGVNRIAALFDHGDETLHAEVVSLAGGLVPWLAASAVVIVVVAFLGWRQVVSRRRQAFLVPVLVTLILCFSLLSDIFLRPRANHFKSGKEFVAASMKEFNRADQVFLFASDFSGVYNLYTGRVSMPVLRTPADIEEALSRPDKTAVIGQDRKLLWVLGNPPRQGRIAVSKRVGHRKMVLLTNWEPNDNGANSGS